MKWQPNNVKEAILPILICNWVYGLGIFEYPLYRYRPFASTIYTVVTKLTIIYLYITILSILNESANWLSQELILFIFYSYMSLVVGMLVLLLNWRHQKFHRLILEKCDIVDNTLYELGIRKNYEQLFSLSVKFVFTWIACYTTLAVSDAFFLLRVTKFSSLTLGIFANVVMQHFMHIVGVSDFTFIIYTRFIIDRFKKVNHLTENTLRIFRANFKGASNNSSTIVEAISVEKTRKLFVQRCTLQHLLLTIRMLHLELHRITRTINTAYYAQIILQLTSHFIQMICCFCSVYYLSKIRTSPTPKSVEFFITLIWIVIFTIKVTVLSHVCDRVSTEAQKIGRIIQEIDYYSTNVEVREEVHQITMQMILNPVHLTACGFFRLNRSLISKFFGSICTYVFIIIQMSDS